MCTERLRLVLAGRILACTSLSSSRTTIVVLPLPTGQGVLLDGFLSRHYSYRCNLCRHSTASCFRMNASVQVVEDRFMAGMRIGWEGCSNLTSFSGWSFFFFLAAPTVYSEPLLVLVHFRTLCYIEALGTWMNTSCMILARADISGCITLNNNGIDHISCPTANMPS